MLNIDFFKTLLNGIKSRFTSQQKQITNQQKQIDVLTTEQNELSSRPSETVLYTPQDLTDEEKQQVLENIGLRGSQDLSELYFVTFRDAGSSYSCDNSAADIIANLPKYHGKNLMVGTYIDFPDSRASSNQILYLDYYERNGDNYKIKFTSFRTLERKGEYFGSAGFDVAINLVNSVFTVEKVIRYNTDVIYQMTKSSTDGKYHLYLNGSEVEPNGIMLDSQKNCCIDYAGSRYFCTVSPNQTSPEFFTIDSNARNSNYEISKIVLDKRLNSIEVTDFESIYTLPTATSATLGGVKPVAKTDAMTQDVGVDENGKLYTEPAEGGTDLSLDITGAAVGQIAKISAVDTDGVPTAWTPVDMPSLPTVNTSDNGKFLRVVNGAWAAAEIQNANGEEF